MQGRVGMGRWKGIPINPSSRNQEDQQSPHAALRAEFFEHYSKEAKEYDAEFMKKHDDDIGSTLIFVCPVHRLGTQTLTCGIGRSALRCDFRVYHSSPLRVPTRLQW